MAKLGSRSSNSVIVRQLNVRTFDLAFPAVVHPAQEVVPLPLLLPFYDCVMDTLRLLQGHSGDGHVRLERAARLLPGLMLCLFVDVSVYCYSYLVVLAHRRCRNRIVYACIAAARGVRLYGTALLTVAHYLARVLFPGCHPCHPR